MTHKLHKWMRKKTSPNHHLTNKDIPLCQRVNMETKSYWRENSKKEEKQKTWRQANGIISNKWFSSYNHSTERLSQYIPASSKLGWQWFCEMIKQVIVHRKMNSRSRSPKKEVLKYWWIVVARALPRDYLHTRLYSGQPNFTRVNSRKRANIKWQERPTTLKQGILTWLVQREERERESMRRKAYVGMTAYHIERELTHR